MNFERKAIDEIDADGSTVGKKYYYPRKEFACYNSIINQSKVAPMFKNEIPMNIYEYLDSLKSKQNGTELASLYYTALGRERQGMNKIN